MNQNLFTEQESPQLPALVNNDILKTSQGFFLLFLLPTTDRTVHDSQMA